MPAQFKGNAHHIGGTLCQEDATHFGASSETHMANGEAIKECISDGGCIKSSDDVEYTGRESSFNGKFCNRQRTQWRLLCGLDHLGATSSKCGAHLSCHHGDRKVPWGDCRRHARGLAEHQQALARITGWNRFAVDTLAFFRVPLKKASGVGNFYARLGERLATLLAAQIGKAFHIAQHQFSQTAKGLGALDGCQILPGRKRACCGVNSGARIACITVGNVRDVRIRRWIVDRKGAPGARGYERSVDEARSLHREMVKPGRSCRAPQRRHVRSGGGV